MIPSVVRLFERGGPPAVARFIVPERVNSVEAGACWTRPHVAEKCREVRSPLVADSHAAPTVVFKAGRARIFAADASDHPPPICARPRHVARRSVLALLSHLRHQLSPQAAARARIAIGQVLSADGLRL